jgi:hypothetical protein
MNTAITQRIDWRGLGRAAIRIVALTTAAGLMVGGKLLYISGARLQHFGEELGK